MAFELTGQTALVTGAATGIGEAIARRLAKAVAAVAVADLNLAGAAQVARSIGGSAFPLEIDIAQSESADAAIAAIIARHGQIDILVNNAGIGGKAAPLWEQTDQDWHYVIGINLMGVVHCTRAAITHMRSRKYGRVVTWQWLNEQVRVAGRFGTTRIDHHNACAARLRLGKSSAG